MNGSTATGRGRNPQAPERSAIRVAQTVVWCSVQGPFFLISSFPVAKNVAARLGDRQRECGDDWSRMARSNVAHVGRGGPGVNPIARAPRFSSESSEHQLLHPASSQIVLRITHSIGRRPCIDRHASTPRRRLSDLDRPRFAARRRASSPGACDRRATAASPLIVGEAGVGKSRLLRAMTEEARARASSCCTARVSRPSGRYHTRRCSISCDCSPASASPALVAHVLAPAASELVAVFPELRQLLPDADPSPTIDPESDKRRLFHALGQVVTSARANAAGLPRVRGRALERRRDARSRLPSRAEPRLTTRRRSRSRIAVKKPGRASCGCRRVRASARRRRASRSSDWVATTLARCCGRSSARARTSATTSCTCCYGLTEGNPFFVEETLKGTDRRRRLSRRRAAVGGARPLERVRVRRPPSKRYAGGSPRSRCRRERSRPSAAVAGRRFDFELLRNAHRPRRAGAAGARQGADRRAARRRGIGRAIRLPSRAHARGHLRRAARARARRAAPARRRRARTEHGGCARRRRRGARLPHVGSGRLGARRSVRGARGAARHWRCPRRAKRSRTSIARSPRPSGRASRSRSSSISTRGRANETLGEFQRGARRLHRGARRARATARRSRRVGGAARARHAVGGARLRSRRRVSARGVGRFARCSATSRSSRAA